MGRRGLSPLSPAAKQAPGPSQPTWLSDPEAPPSSVGTLGVEGAHSC